MGWVKLDDSFFTNDKSREVGKDGRELYTAGLCHAAANGTNGVLKASDLPLLAALAEVRLSATLPKLVKAGMWHEPGHDCTHPKCEQPPQGGYFIHRYLDRNPTAEEERERRERLSAIRAAAGRKGGQSKAGKPQSKGGGKPPSNPVAPRGKPRPSDEVRKDGISTSVAAPAALAAEGSAALAAEKPDTRLDDEQRDRNISAARAAREALRSAS